MSVSIKLLACNVRCAADINLIYMIRIGTEPCIIENTKRRVEHLQGFHGILDIHLFQFVARHDSCRTRKTVLFQFLKTRYYHLVYLCSILFQINSKVPFLTNGELA